MTYDGPIHRPSPWTVDQWMDLVIGPWSESIPFSGTPTASRPQMNRVTRTLLRIDRTPVQKISRLEGEANPFDRHVRPVLGARNMVHVQDVPNHDVVMIDGLVIEVA